MRALMWLRPRAKGGGLVRAGPPPTYTAGKVARMQIRKLAICKLRENVAADALRFPSTGRPSWTPYTRKWTSFGSKWTC
jgi:hypothetical protein